VDFLEHFSKEAARRKMIYLVQFGLHAYFSHKVIAKLIPCLFRGHAAGRQTIIIQVIC
jgi:hypothetical protein